MNLKEEGVVWKFIYLRSNKLAESSVGPPWIIKFKAVYQEILEYFRIPTAKKLYIDGNFFLQQVLEPVVATLVSS